MTRSKTVESLVSALVILLIALLLLLARGDTHRGLGSGPAPTASGALGRDHEVGPAGTTPGSPGGPRSNRPGPLARGSVGE